MINLKIPEDVGIAVYDDIISNKTIERKSRLLYIRNEVERRYDEYKENASNLENIKEEKLFFTYKDDLKSCYGDNKEFNSSAEMIRQLQSVAMQARCPYCGLNEPDTLDHYLPKGKFPEFSVLGINLIPCCGTCNRLKGEKWLANDIRRFLNFYFDEVPIKKILYITVSFKDNGEIPTINFELKNPGCIKSKLFSIVQQHFRDLSLIERYQIQVNDKITELYDEMSEGFMFLTKEELKRNLGLKINSFKKRYGSNNWEVCLYEGVLECDEFFDKCYERSDEERLTKLLLDELPENYPDLDDKI